MDGEIVVHAERECRGVHHPEPSLDRLEVSDRRQELRVRAGPRIAVVDPFDPVLGHQDALGVDLERAQGGGGVGGEVRVAGPGREDHDPAFLEMPDRAAANVRLRDLADVERREHTCVGAVPLE
jgi:hypothetical protein